MRPSIDSLCRSLGYSFSDITLIEQALTHRSAGGLNNERFEFLGDAILGFVIADVLFQHFGHASEGQLSRLRSSLVKRDTLAIIARQHQVGDYLHLGSGELRSGGQSRDSILADAVEAIIAAVYLDGGYDSSRKVILDLFEERLEKIDLTAQQKDPKTRLQEFFQARKQGLPSYEVVSISGDPHDQNFKIRCQIAETGNETLGEGSSRRRAEQDAAQQMLQGLKDA